MLDGKSSKFAATLTVWQKSDLHRSNWTTNNFPANDRSGGVELHEGFMAPPVAPNYFSHALDDPRDSELPTIVENLHCFGE